LIHTHIQPEKKRVYLCCDRIRWVIFPSHQPGWNTLEAELRQSICHFQISGGMMTFPQMQHQFGEVKSGEVQMIWNKPTTIHYGIWIFFFFDIIYNVIYIYIYMHIGMRWIMISSLAPWPKSDQLDVPKSGLGNPRTKWRRSCEILRKPLENIGQILEIPYKWKNHP